MTVVPKLDVDRQQPDLVAIETRLAAATDPPWSQGKREEGCIVTRNGEGLVILRRGVAGLSRADFHLIAHAPADLRTLVDEVKRLRCEVDENGKYIEESESEVLRLKLQLINRKG